MAAAGEELLSAMPAGGEELVPAMPGTREELLLVTGEEVPLASAKHLENIPPHTLRFRLQNSCLGTLSTQKSNQNWG